MSPAIVPWLAPVPAPRASNVVIVPLGARREFYQKRKKGIAAARGRKRKKR